MENVAAPSVRRRVTLRGCLPAFALVAALATGCVTTSNLTPWTAEKPAAGVCQLVCTWQNSVLFVPDTAHGGTPTPGVMGRLYLFGQKLDFPVRAEGSLVVDLYDETGGPPVMLERWNIDPETLHRLAKKDMIGDGYTLFLPWHKYRPEISKIQLRTGFQEGKTAAPIFTQNTVTLADTNGVIRESTTPLTPMPARKPGPPAGPLGMNPNLPMGSAQTTPAGPTLPPPTPAK